jgi:hypothetical protein
MPPIINLIIPGHAGRVWLATPRLGMGKSLTFFYSVEVGYRRLGTCESICSNGGVYPDAGGGAGGGGMSPPRISTAGNCDKDNKRNNNCPRVLPLSVFFNFFQSLSDFDF